MMPEEKKSLVVERLNHDYDEFRKAARNWSGVYHGFQFGSAALTAASALILKSEFIGSIATRNDIGAALAATAALAIAILTSGRFKEKWEANRIAAFAVRDLQYEIEKDEIDLNALLSSLQRIGLTRNGLIVGSAHSQR